jgi:VIT1/CCC1 family predicted Fe2+/Mn2+ transporter
MDPRLLKSAVLGASDGIVTTFAVVAGVAGAGLSSNVIVILGVANMVADGLSMSIGDYLGERSEQQFRYQQTGNKQRLKLWQPGVIMFLAFNLAGVLPLFPYLLTPLLGLHIPAEIQFPFSIFATALAMFIVGSLRSLVLHTSWVRNGFEMLAVGSIAATVAYVLGSIVEKALLN